jgi:signal transduction histidine kinase
VTRGRIENASEERGAKQILRSAEMGDVQIEADIQTTVADGEAGLLVRSGGEQVGVDAYHGYFAGVRAADSLLEFGRADFGWHALGRLSLPEGMELERGFHLRVVAVGCSFGVEVRARNGMRQTLEATDDRCLRSGHSGVRSTLTSTTWDHLSLRAASASDLAVFRTQTAAGRSVSFDQPYDMARSASYEASLRREARLRSLQAGVQPISNFLMQPGRHPNVTLQGTIISLPPLIAIQDDTNALIVPHLHPDRPFKLGDIVIAKGTVVSERFRSSLEDAEIRVLWHDRPIPPLAVTAAQLTGGTYRGRTIALEGTLVTASDGALGQEMILRDGDLIFRGVGTPDYRIDVSSLELGSRLRIRGLATSLSEFTNGTYPFAVLVGNVDIVSSPPWWSPRHIFLLMLGCVALVLAVQFALHRAQQWRLQSVMREREQLAFEMHDTLAQSFTGIAFQLKAASLERRGEDWVRRHIQHALEMVNLSHKEASRTIAALRPQLRDATAIVEALEQAANRLADDGSFSVAIDVSGRMVPLPVQVTDSLFRIGQEAIGNAVQHSGATGLKITLVVERSEARLSVRDNGCGFEVTAPHAGLGLAGMHSRANKVRGRVEIRSWPGLTGQGSEVTVIAPLPLSARLLGPLRSWLPSSAKHPLRLATAEERRRNDELHV